MIEMYRDPLFLLFPLASLAVAGFGFLLFALPMHWLAMKDPTRLRHLRLQKRVVRPRAVRQCLSRLAINFLCLAALAFLLWPVLRFSRVHADGPIPWLDMLWQLPLFVAIDDVLYYVLHRLLHTRWLYRNIHIVHHRMTAPTAFAGAYFHPIEYAAVTLVALAGPVLLGSHVATIWAWGIVRQWSAVEGHCGYALPFGLAAVIPGYDPAFHDGHHKRFAGNYANCIPALDRRFGTLAPGYAARGTP